MTSESLSTGDGAEIIVSQHHTIQAMIREAASLRTPAEHFGHSTEELIDLAATRYHGGDRIVHPTVLHEALSPGHNAVRLIVRNPLGELKQLILGTNLRSNKGGIWQANLMGGLAGYSYVNNSGSVAYTATTVTPGASPTWTVGDYIGQVVIAPTTTGTTPSFVFGNIINSSATALTVDGWYVLPTAAHTVLTGAAGSTPVTNGSFVILPHSAPAGWIAISSDTAAADQGDTTLTSEITTGFSTNPRWLGTYSLTTTPTTTGNATQQTAVYKIDAGVMTATGTVTIQKLGNFYSKTGGNLMFEKLLAVAATLATSDTVDSSWSISLA